jgi:hypothetical protein
MLCDTQVIIKRSQDMNDKVRVLRIIEYIGDREWVLN